MSDYPPQSGGPADQVPDLLAALQRSVERARAAGIPTREDYALAPAQPVLVPADSLPCPVCGGDRLRPDHTGSGRCHAGTPPQADPVVGVHIDPASLPADSDPDRAEDAKARFLVAQGGPFVVLPPNPEPTPCEDCDVLRTDLALRDAEVAELRDERDRYRHQLLTLDGDRERIVATLRENGIEPPPLAHDREPESARLRGLLVRYRQHVLNCEGIDFLDYDLDRFGDGSLTAEDVEAIRREANR